MERIRRVIGKESSLAKQKYVEISITTRRLNYGYTAEY